MHSTPAWYDNATAYEVDSTSRPWMTWITPLEQKMSFATRVGLLHCDRKSWRYACGLGSRRLPNIQRLFNVLEFFDSLSGWRYPEISMCLHGSRRLSIRKFRVSGSCGAGAVVYSEYCVHVEEPSLGSRNRDF